jgi:hypothetical protein
MGKIIPISEHFQHFLAEMKDSFWGDLYGQTRQAWQHFFELQSERQLPVHIAEAYARLGDKDKAFEWLERAYRERDGVRLGFINSQQPSR